jgi:YD repeat-containing protein
MGNLSTKGERSMKYKFTKTNSCLFILVMLVGIPLFAAPVGDNSPQTLLSQGLSLETSRPHHYADAITIYQSIVENYPDNPLIPFVQLHIGSSLSNLDQFGAAIVDLQKVVDNYASTTCAPRALEMIAFVKTRDTNCPYDEQIAAFQAIIDKYPDSSQAKTAPTYIKNLTKRMVLMPTVAMRKALLPLFEDAWQYQPLGYRSRAVEDYNKILASDIAISACKAEAQLQKAGLIFEIAKGEDIQYKPTGPADRNRLLQQAREECQKVLQYEPSLKQHAIADLMVVETFYWGEDYASAITYGEKYTQLYGPSFTWPEDMDVLTHVGNGKFTVGFAKYRAGDYSNAIRDYQDIISLWPEHPVCARAQLEIGRCYYELHDYSQAVRAFSQLVSTYPNSPFATQAQQSISNIQRVFLSFLSVPVPRVYVKNEINNSLPVLHAAAYSPKLADVNCGPVALKAVLDHYGISADVQELSRLAGLNEKGTSLAGLANAAQEKGLIAKGIKINPQDISQIALSLPAVVQLNYSQTNHFVALQNISQKGIEFSDSGNTKQMSLSEFNQRFTGYALLFNSSDSRLSLSGRKMNSVIGTGVPPPPPPAENGNPPAGGINAKISSSAVTENANAASKTENTIPQGSGKPIVENGSIDLTSGQVTHSGTIKATANKGIPVVIELSHLSYDHVDGAGPGPFGIGTDWSYGDFLKDNGSEIIWYQSPFAKRIFTNNGSGYTAPKGVTATLAKHSDGTYTITLKNGTKNNFDSNGKWISQTDANGNQNNFQYKGNQLTAIVDASSQVTQIYYDSSERVSSIQDAAGGLHKFEYSNNGDLISQTDPDNQTYYQYDGSHRVTKVTNNNVVKNYVYDSAGKCASVESVDSNNPANNYSYSYGYDTVLYIAWSVGSGNDTTYYIYNNRTWQTDCLISKGVKHTFVYDGSYNLVADIVSGSTTRFVWDNQRNLLSTVSQ